MTYTSQKFDIYEGQQVKSVSSQILTFKEEQNHTRQGDH